MCKFHETAREKFLRCGDYSASADNTLKFYWIFLSASYIKFLRHGTFVTERRNTKTDKIDFHAAAALLSENVVVLARNLAHVSLYVSSNCVTLKTYKK